MWTCKLFKQEVKYYYKVDQWTVVHSGRTVCGKGENLKAKKNKKLEKISINNR